MSQSISPEPYHITNLAAARRQLSTAIELWFNGGDTVSIHTLACASHEIIHGLSRKRRTRDLLFDTLIIKDEHRKDFIDLIRKPGNFFKHPSRDGREDRKISFNPILSEQFILFSILGLELIGKPQNEIEYTFMTWNYIHKPHLLTAEGRKIYVDEIPIEGLENIRSIPKDEFFKYVSSARRDYISGKS